MRKAIDLLAFPGGKGTADMVRQAKAAGVKVIDHRSALAQFPRLPEGKE
jgi:hypothetical protein